MSRFFDGSAGVDQYITLAPGALLDGGPITVMWYWRPESGEAGQHGGFLSGRTAGTNQWSASCDGGNYFHENDFTGYNGVDPDEWQIIGYSKPAGSTNVRWHYFDLSTVVWDHADGTVAGDGSNIDEVLLGIYTPGTGRLRGWWVCAAVWNSVLTDQQVQDACSSIWLLEWFRGNPDALWSGDQSSTSDPVIDHTGNGADQVASLNPAVSSEEPPAWTYSLNASIGTTAFQVGIELAAGSGAAQTGTAAFQVGTELAATGSAPSNADTAFQVGIELAAAGSAPHVGTAAFQVGTELATTGSAQDEGTAAFQTGIELAASGSTTHTGTADFEVGVGLAAGGGQPATGSAPFQVGTALAAEGSTTHAGTAAFTVGVELGAVGSAIHTGTAAFVVGTALAADGNQPDVGGAAFTTGLALQATGARRSAGTAAFVVGIELDVQGMGVGEHIGDLCGSVKVMSLGGSVTGGCNG